MKLGPSILENSIWRYSLSWTILIFVGLHDLALQNLRRIWSKFVKLEKVIRINSQKQFKLD